MKSFVLVTLFCLVCAQHLVLARSLRGKESWVVRHPESLEKAELSYQEARRLSSIPSSAPTSGPIDFASQEDPPETVAKGERPGVVTTLIGVVALGGLVLVTLFLANVLSAYCF